MTLYRKYRPQNFKELVGQNHVKVTLQNEIEDGSIAHAYLFCGPRAVGKTTVSRVFSKAINCLNRKAEEHEPCNLCDMCVKITNGRSLDVIEIDAASHTGVDNVRENIINVAQVSPSESRYRVFIIDEVHMLSASAFNALLKLLEEPPKNVVFILCTTEVHKIPNTIISRCQRFDFRRIGVIDVVKKLEYICNKENISVENGVLEDIARRADGHMRDAESLLGQVMAISGKSITRESADLIIPRSDLHEVVKLIDYLSKKDAGGAITLVNKVVDDGIDLKMFANDLIETLRKVMLGKVSLGLSQKLGLELGETIDMELKRSSENTSMNNIVDWIEKFSKVKNEISGSFIAQLPLEVAIVEICNENTSPSGFKKKFETADNQSINTETSVDGFKNLKTSDTNKEVENEKSVQKICSTVELSLDMIKNRWHEVMAIIKQENHSLSFVLGACSPISVNGDTVTLSFKYKFHRDRIEDRDIKSVLEGVLSRVCKGLVKIKTTINEISNQTEELSVQDSVLKISSDKSYVQEKKEDKGTPSKDDDMISNLLKTFGGEVVG